MTRRSPRTSAGRTSVALTAVLLAAAGPTSARTWLIAPDATGDAPTIQAGIDSAAAGDTVFALPGRFVENIDFHGKAIVVKGSGMGVSTIDGSGQQESCVRFQSGESRASVIQGFTIMSGSGSCDTTPKCYFGGGISMFSSEPTIEENLIVGNEVTDMGGAIFGEASSSSPKRPLIVRNVLGLNLARKNGGGIATASGCVPEILDNTILNNRATEGDGGGIWIGVNTDGTVVTGNRIAGNVAGDHGGGIYAALNSTARPSIEITVVDNLFANNRAGGITRVISSGGGAWMGNVHATVARNTLIMNEGDGPDSAWGGGGIAVDHGDGSLIEGNIIALSGSGGGIRCTGTGSPTIRNNLAWQNVGGDGSGLCASWWQGNGNIVANPYFCDPDGGEYSVAENSPALTHPAGPLGAYPDPGCGPAALEPSTWGRLKTRYRSP